MRILVAGSTGVIGRQLMPLLTSAGHEAVGMVRRPAAAGRHVVADALQPDQVRAAVETVRPDAVVNLLTAIPARINPAKLARDMAMTNRLRTEGARNLLDAARQAGTKRVISEGLAYAYAPGTGLADEDAPLWARGPAQFQPVVAALRELEDRTAREHGLVLRFGHLYGPGTAFARDGSFTADVAAGKVPLVGGGNATFSFTHTRDAAMAVLAGLDKDIAGTLNIVDDEPAPLHEWLPVLAGLLGAKRPKPAPAWLARTMVGSYGVAFMNQLRGADNTRARLALDWRPGYRSWRDGFPAELNH
ncbi:NAD-dependent epimerase/dehydratase family protein [Rugosimonospora africana]|uniref:dTDP-glucose 4,6-dehydratase n=1 Tax=Rugosimonospora africana TaxID=556532 RepID=A0A8J3QWM7_9ACTN|nr:NAD(P)-dependent oxidoreductase [Rugosimonospora africana]GIH18765.1 dTDP-glucose 4,6-dehydratase [Rugosimonospora africana]